MALKILEMWFKFSDSAKSIINKPKKNRKHDLNEEDINEELGKLFSSSSFFSDDGTNYLWFLVYKQKGSRAVPCNKHCPKHYSFRTLTCLYLMKRFWIYWYFVWKDDLVMICRLKIEKSWNNLARFLTILYGRSFKDFWRFSKGKKRACR